QGLGFLAGLQVPHLDRPVITPRVEALAVGAQRQAAHPFRVAAQGESFLAALEVPYLDLICASEPPTSREEALTVAAQPQAGDTIGVAAQGESVTAHQIPYFDGRILTPGEEALAVAAQRQAGDRTVVAAQGEDVLAGIQIPHLDHPTRLIPT